MLPHEPARQTELQHTYWYPIIITFLVIVGSKMVCMVVAVKLSSADGHLLIVMGKRGSRKADVTG